MQAGRLTRRSLATKLSFVRLPLWWLGGFDTGGTAVTITLRQEVHPLRPGSVAVIPKGVPHSLEAEPGQELEFVIFGTPPMSIDDERARPRKV